MLGPRAPIPSSSRRGSLVGIRIYLRVTSVGTLRSYQEQTVTTIQVQLLFLFTCSTSIFFYTALMLHNLILFTVLHAEGGGNLCVSVRDYYCYRLQMRPAIFNPILHGGRLLQQWVVDMYIKIEGCRLNRYRKHQPEIRADLYKGIVDSITPGETRASAVGTRIVLPWKFQGCFRDMKRRHMDAMALVQTYGKPDIFLTMTCNPNWQEI